MGGSDGTDSANRPVFDLRDQHTQLWMDHDEIAVTSPHRHIPDEDVIGEFGLEQPKHPRLTRRDVWKGFDGFRNREGHQSRRKRRKSSEFRLQAVNCHEFRSHQSEDQGVMSDEPRNHSPKPDPFEAGSNCFQTGADQDRGVGQSTSWDVSRLWEGGVSDS